MSLLLYEKYQKYLTKKEVIATQLVVLGSDYKHGFKARYFAKHRCINNIIIEIDKDTYLGILNKKNDYDHTQYSVIKIIWKLTGPINDKKVDNRIIYGVYDTNKRSIENAKIKMPGIEKKITNYIEYTKLDTEIHQPPIYLDTTLRLQKDEYSV